MQRLKETEYLKEVILSYAKHQEEKMKHFAQLLHKDVANKLSVLSLFMNNAEAWEDKRAKEIIVEQLPQLMAITRSIMHDLYPVHLERFGLILSLESLISNINFPFSIRLIQQQHYHRRPFFVELQLYRIIQEYLDNVLETVPCSKLYIIVRDTNAGLFVMIADNRKKVEISALKSSKLLQCITARTHYINAVSKWKSNASEGLKLIIRYKS